MDIGIGLPGGVPGTSRDDMLGWARRAEDRGFATLGVIDRLVYRNWEPLIALAGAAAVTERIKLLTSILIVPYRANAALLAKQAATLQTLADGRLTLGVGLGGRSDDYAVSGVALDGRGERMDADVAELAAVWAGVDRGVAGAIGPVPDDAPPLLMAGFADATFERAARHGAGWIGAGGGPDAFAAGAERMRAAWRLAGRPGEPRLAMIAYFGLGDPDATRAYLGDYYAFAGRPELTPPGEPLAHVGAEVIVGSAITSAEMARGACDAFAAAGCDELVLVPTIGDPAEVDLLADAVLGRAAV